MGVFFVLIGLSLGTFALSSRSLANWGDCRSDQLEVVTNKTNCLMKSEVLLDRPSPTPKAEDIAKELSPSLYSGALSNQRDVFCRFVFEEQGGNSAKFRCLLTDSQNRLLNRKGELVPEAVNFKSENDEEFLVNASGAKIPSAEDKTGFQRARKLKVRYADGKSRNRENYTSSAASRILNLMGIPAHTYVMTSAVKCFGCTPSPFGKQNKPLKDATEAKKMKAQWPQPFLDAAVEIKFEGERLYAPEDSAWSFDNVFDQVLSQEVKLEFEVLLLANHFLGYTNDGSGQNQMVCASFDKLDAANCAKVVAMVHDIGAAFGTRIKKGLGDRPRGDIKAYEKSRIFKPGTCEFIYQGDENGNLPSSISKVAKEEFLVRARGLDFARLREVFTTSRMGYLETDRSAAAVAERTDRWARAVEQKLLEVQSAPCP